MTYEEYEMFDHQVENKMKYSNGEWFTLGWSQMHTIAEDKVNAGTLEKRWNDVKSKIECRRL